MLELASETTVKKNYLNFIKIYQFGTNFSLSNFENLAPRIRSDFFSEFELHRSFYGSTLDLKKKNMKDKWPILFYGIWTREHYKFQRLTEWNHSIFSEWNFISRFEIFFRKSGPLFYVHSSTTLPQNNKKKFTTNSVSIKSIKKVNLKFIFTKYF
jgi:hypothetical protein